MQSYFTLTEIYSVPQDNTYGTDPIILDLDGDGFLDVVVPYVSSDTSPVPVRFFRGDGLGGFTEFGSVLFPNGVPMAVGPGSAQLIADFNGDGRPDIFVNDWGYDAPPYPGSHNLLLLTGPSPGIFDESDRVTSETTDHTYYASYADIDSDGDLDIFVGNAFAQHAPYFLVNDGFGNFTRTSAGIPVDAIGGMFEPDGVLNGLDFIGSQSAFVDANSDGKLDLVIMSGASDQPSFLLIGDGAGSFTQTSLTLPSPQNQSSYAEAILSGDLNGDGQTDLVISYQLESYTAGKTVIFINDGNGQFHDETESRMLGGILQDSFTYELQWVDLNRDNVLDLFAAGGSERGVVYLGDGLGNFVFFPLDIFTGTGAQAVDVNSDGRLDFIIPFSTGSLDNLLSQGLRVLLGVDAGLIQVGDASDNGLMGDHDNEDISGLGGDDVLFGGAGTDTLDGGGGHDYLNGGGGNDTMRGGTGNDSYFLDNSGDDVIELAGEGTDTVKSLISYWLGTNVENLVLLGSAALNGTGNSLANTITGNTGANTLNGKGGVDRMVGGLGDDIYYVDNAGDTTVEGAGAGADEVRSSLDWVLAANVETLSLIGSADIDGTGNSAANRINGNSGANVLSGLGGSDTIYGLGGTDVLNGAAGNDSLNGGLGADSMTGGTGNDIYYVDDAGDTVTELAGEGVDIVRSTVSYTLAANVDRLELNGSASIDGTGNGDSNRITGNSGDNDLSGLGGTDYLYGVGGNDTLVGGDGNDLLNGGAGTDSLIGGAGKDLYYVDSAGDSVTELAAEGFDTIRSTVSYTLAANTERLELIGSAGIDGTGNSASNRVNGNGGANVLSGLGGNDIIYGLGGNDTLDGGAGRDFLVGGTGADSFVFDDGDFWGLTGASCDRIDDFNHALGDVVDLSAVDADTGISGDQAFAFIGSGAFSGTAGELRYEQSGVNTLVYGDTDGDGNADFLILLLGSHTLTLGDFVI